MDGAVRRNEVLHSLRELILEDLRGIPVETCFRIVPGDDLLDARSNLRRSIKSIDPNTCSGSSGGGP